jgi:signal transduction histidine kinase
MKWWHVGTGTLVVLLLGLVGWMPRLAPEMRLLAAGALVAFAVLYAVWGQRLLRQDCPRATGYLGASILVVAVGVFAEPNLLIMQCLLFPLIWVLSSSIRHAIMLNVVAAPLFVVAYATGLGGSGHLWIEAFFIEGLSLGFSIVLGLWINNIAELGRQKSQLYDELAAAQDQLAGLSRDAGAAAERERIARDIHDTIAQSVTGIVMLAQRGRRELDEVSRDDARDGDSGERSSGERSSVDASSGGSGDRPAQGAAAETFEMIESMGREALEEARALVATLAKLPDSDATLEQALRRVAERFGRETALRVDVETDALPPLPRELEVMLLRCAQEGLANVRKHARATAAVVSLRVEDGFVELRVDDDGRGYPAEAETRSAGEPENGTETGAGARTGTDTDIDALSARGFGLAGMRERLALANGTLSIRTLRTMGGEPVGASLTARAPLPTRAPAPAPTPAPTSAPVSAVTVSPTPAPHPAAASASAHTTAASPAASRTAHAERTS